MTNGRLPVLPFPGGPRTMRVAVAGLVACNVALALFAGSGCAGRVAPAAEQGGRQPERASRGPAALLVCTPQELEYGTIGKGGKRQRQVWLHNPGQEPVEVMKVETSCECFSVELAAKVVPPGGKVAATARVDLTSDPKFAGNLGLEAKGRAAKGKQPAFVLRAFVRVE